jgi:hypothetical protein
MIAFSSTRKSSKVWGSGSQASGVVFFSRNASANIPWTFA